MGGIKLDPVPCRKKHTHKMKEEQTMTVGKIIQYWHVSF